MYIELMFCFIKQNTFYFCLIRSPRQSVHKMLIILVLVLITALIFVFHCFWRTQENVQNMWKTNIKILLKCPLNQKILNSPATFSLHKSATIRGNFNRQGNLVKDRGGNKKRHLAVGSGEVCLQLKKHKWSSGCDVTKRTSAAIAIALAWLKID